MNTAHEFIPGIHAATCLLMTPSCQCNTCERDEVSCCLSHAMAKLIKHGSKNRICPVTKCAGYVKVAPHE